MATWLRRNRPAFQICGIDNFVRPGSETNRLELKRLGVTVYHGDIRNASDFENLPAVDWVIDAAANPSVLAGVDGVTSSRQITEHNLQGTLNILEYCKRNRSGLVLLSTSRVYSIPVLCSLPIKSTGQAFEWTKDSAGPAGSSADGIDVNFSTAAPLSLYGATKLASEIMALEYAEGFSFPLWINRCGVLAGAGQFGTAEQGIFSYWLHACAQKRPLNYIGFDGSGHQVRDALHPDDLAELIVSQLETSDTPAERTFNVGGGASNSMSLKELSAWCAGRFGKHEIGIDPKSRKFDVPWLIMDNRRVNQQFGWSPKRSLDSILTEIAEHASANPDWLNLSSPK